MWCKAVDEHQAVFLDICFEDGLSILLTISHGPFLSFLNGDYVNPLGDGFCFDCFQVVLDCTFAFVSLCFLKSADINVFLR